jgi:hypothetical protein
MKSFPCHNLSYLNLSSLYPTLGLEKKLELDELAWARSSSARLGPARRSERARVEPVLWLVKRASQLGAARELARGSIQ